MPELTTAPVVYMVRFLDTNTYENQIYRREKQALGRARYWTNHGWPSPRPAAVDTFNLDRTRVEIATKK